MLVSMNFRTLALGLAITVLLSCASVEPKPSLEGRAVNLDQRLICPVCPSETIDQSQTELAKQMRNVVRQQLQEGYSDRQIEEYFVSRYGERVLASPSNSGIGLLVWIFPPLVVGIGLFVFLLVLRQMRRNQLLNENEIIDNSWEEKPDSRI